MSKHYFTEEQVKQMVPIYYRYFKIWHINWILKMRLRQGFSFRFVVLE